MSLKRTNTGSTIQSHATTPADANSVSELYTDGKKIFSTRSATACEVHKHGENGTTWLWTLDYPLKPLSADAITFVKEISAAVNLNIPMPRIEAYGVDAHGKAYIGFETAVARVIPKSGYRQEDVESIFVGMCEIVAELNNNQIVLGNISEDSFLVEDNTILLGCPISSDEKLRSKHNVTNSPRVDSYTSPEQRKLQKISKTSDIYSLGVYLYRLITLEDCIIADSHEAQKTFIDQKLPAEIAAEPKAPGWALEVLQRCLAYEPDARFQSADELLSFIDRRSDGAASGRRKVVKSTRATSSAAAQSGENILTSINNFYLIIFGLVLVGSLVVVGAASLWAGQEKVVEKPPVKIAPKPQKKPRPKRRDVWTPPRFTPSPNSDRYSAARQKTSKAKRKFVPFVESQPEKAPSKASTLDLPFEAFSELEKDNTVKNKNSFDRPDKKLGGGEDSRDFYHGPGDNAASEGASNVLGGDNSNNNVKKLGAAPNYFGPGPQVGAESKGGTTVDDSDLESFYGDLPIDTEQ